MNLPDVTLAEAGRCAKLRSASSALARVAGLIGLFVLTGGWMLNVSFLRSIIPGAASMKVNTALGVMLTAGALNLVDNGRAYLRRLAFVCGAFLTLISLITLIEYATGRNLGVDELLLPDRTPPVLVTAPGRMSFVTAVSFLFLGCAVVLRSRVRRRAWDQCLPLAAAVLCLSNLIGYLYGIDNFAGIAFYTGMAVHTSFSLLMLSLSVLFSEPRRGLTALLCSENNGGVLTRRLFPAAVLVPLSLGWLCWQGERRGLYGTAFGLAMFATANIVVFAYLIWTAGWQLDRIDGEKGRAAALLQTRESLLSTFVKHVPAAVAMLDRDLRFIQVSDRWFGDTGIGSCDIRGKSIADTLPGLSQELCRRGLAGESAKSEGDWVALDGNTHTVRLAVRPWDDSGANTGGVVVFFEDITERKKKELELRKFVSLADNSAEFIGMCDMNLMPFYANRSSIHLIGLDSVEQAMRTPVPEFFFPEDQRFIVEEFFPRVFREGRAEVEIRFRHFKTGKPVWMIYNVFYIKDADDRPVGLATVSRDITERRKAEDAQREKEATIGALLETAAQAILAVSAGGNIVLANGMAGEMFGYQPDELLGQQIEVLLPRRLRLRHEAHRAAFLANPKARPMGMELGLHGVRKDGSEFPIEVSLSSLQTASGPLAVSFVSDITDRKRAEAALQASEQHLRDLTGSLITAQEDERRRLSRELHDDVTQQLAFLSIEIGLLKQQTNYPFEDTRARLTALQDQALRMTDEIRRMSHGLHPSVIEDFGLSVALEEFCDEFARAQEIDVRFEGLIDDSQLSREAATCLYRIVQESLRNALQHGRATEACVCLSADDHFIHLRIRDNGSGFETDRVRDKPGLGIISMKERVRLVHGMLTHHSRPGRGTEVAVSVPLTRANAGV